MRVSDTQVSEEIRKAGVSECLNSWLHAFLSDSLSLQALDDERVSSRLNDFLFSSNGLG